MSQIPNNSAAEQVVQAQSIIADLTKQSAELHLAIERQQNIVGMLLPLATWAEEPVPSVEEPEEPETPQP